MSGVLQGMHEVGWEDVPLLAMETAGADSFNACVKAGDWVELNGITRCVHGNAALHMCVVDYCIICRGKNYDVTILCNNISVHACEFCSIAKTLGAKRVCKRAYDWLSQHEIISRVVSDKEAVSACLKIAGEC